MALVGVVVAGALVVAGVVVSVQASANEATRPEVSMPRATASVAAAAAGPETSTSLAGSGSSAGPLIVHVAGAVLHAGVYSLPAGSRANDALNAAGGPMPDADPDQIDLAARLNDGDRVYVPRRGEQVPVAVGPSSGANGTAFPVVVDVNSATAEQLDALPGVGPSLASAIVEYRHQHGRFRSPQDLLDVPGIGPAKLAALRSRVTVGQ